MDKVKVKKNQINKLWEVEDKELEIMKRQVGVSKIQYLNTYVQNIYFTDNKKSEMTKNINFLMH